MNTVLLQTTNLFRDYRAALRIDIDLKKYEISGLIHFESVDFLPAFCFS